MQKPFEYHPIQSFAAKLHRIERRDHPGFARIMKVIERILLNPEDADAVGVLDDRAVVVESRRGTVRTRAKLTEDVPKGTIFMAFHWREAPANMLTQDFALDPVAKIPEYKVCAVRLVNPRAKREKVPA